MTMMKLSISVYPSDATAGGGGRLFVREVDWPTLPQDDGITEIGTMFSTDEYGGEWYAHTRIYRSFFHVDGTIHIELVGWQVDPIPLMQDYCQRPRTDRRPWWSDRDGDPAEQLLASGWREYEADPVKDWLNRIEKVREQVALLDEHPGVAVGGQTTIAISDLFHDGFTALGEALIEWPPRPLDDES